MIRAAIVDDHPISRWGIERALTDQGDAEVVASVGSLAELRADPDVVLLDLYLAGDEPCLDGIREFALHTRVLVVSASRRTADVEAALRAGAHGFVHKASDPRALAEAAARVADGGHVGFSRRVDVPGPADVPRDPEGTDPGRQALARLSQRESQILDLIADGYTHDQAARRLGIARNTVDTYVKRLRKKLGEGNKARLTTAALLARTMGSRVLQR